MKVNDSRLSQVHREQNEPWKLQLNVLQLHRNSQSCVSHGFRVLRLSFLSLGSFVNSMQLKLLGLRGIFCDDPPSVDTVITGSMSLCSLVSICKTVWNHLDSSNTNHKNQFVTGIHLLIQFEDMSIDRTILSFYHFQLLKEYVVVDVLRHILPAQSTGFLWNGGNRRMLWKFLTSLCILLFSIQVSLPSR